MLVSSYPRYFPGELAPRDVVAGPSYKDGTEGAN